MSKEKDRKESRDMDLREKLNGFRGTAEHARLRGWPDNGSQPTVEEYERLLAALDLQEAVRWCEENRAEVGYSVEPETVVPGWRVGAWVPPDRGSTQRWIDATATTLPEAVGMLRAKLDKEKEPTRE